MVSEKKKDLTSISVLTLIIGILLTILGLMKFIWVLGTLFYFATLLIVSFFLLFVAAVGAYNLENLGPWYEAEPLETINEFFINYAQYFSIGAIPFFVVHLIITAFDKGLSKAGKIGTIIFDIVLILLNIGALIVPLLIKIE